MSCIDERSCVGTIAAAWLGLSLGAPTPRGRRRRERGSPGDRPQERLGDDQRRSTGSSEPTSTPWRTASSTSSTASTTTTTGIATTAPTCQATSPMTVMVMDETSGYRLLPWHRAFLLEGRSRCSAPRSASERRKRASTRAKPISTCSIPVLGRGARSGSLHWVPRLQSPRAGRPSCRPACLGARGVRQGGGRALRHRLRALAGQEPGLRYAAERPIHVERILAKPTFADFYDALVVAELCIEDYQRRGRRWMCWRSSCRTARPSRRSSTLSARSPSSSQRARGDDQRPLRDRLEIQAVEARRRPGHVELVGAVKDVYSLFNFMPTSGCAYQRAGGLDPAGRGRARRNDCLQRAWQRSIRGVLDAPRRGSILHLVYMEKTHADEPPLEGDDRASNPLTASEGAWYGGGKTYTLDDLTAYDALPYVTSVLFDG